MSADSHAPQLNVAQLNIGRFRFPTDDPRMAGFMANLDRVNAIAERSRGFVWRPFGWAYLPPIKLWMAKKCG